ncbi:MAG TPA: hypothetical protein VFS88_01295, partial [Micavibrio sp.]|nr:hypothetical protein [Micavibrio sp.]
GMHSQRMNALGDKINVKITVQEGDDFLILNSAQHRWFPKRLSKNKIFLCIWPQVRFPRF